MFEKASRLKLRFVTNIGTLSADDLWDLPLTHATSVSLDSLAMTYNQELEKNTVKSFVTPTKSTTSLVQLRFDIVKHIIDDKIKARDEAKDRETRRAKKNRIMEIIARKQDAELEGTNIEDLQKMMDDL